jgi:hypothetical protein
MSGHFRNVIVCEDIRDEAGNKKSLMGVMAGDILVANFPATISIAIFMEYLPDAKDGTQLVLDIRVLQDAEEIAKAKVEAPVIVEQPALMKLPRALVTFEKEATFRLLASINGQPEQELLSKRIGKTLTS